MKKFSLIGFIVLAVSVSIYVTFQSDLPVDQKVLHQKEGSMNSFSNLSASSASSHLQDNKTQDHAQASEEKPRWDSGGVAGTPAEEEVVRKWEQDRGYLSKDRQKLGEYKSLDIPSLKIMIDSGDLLAQSELIRRSYGDARTGEIYKALAMGSTEAVMSLGLELEGAYEEKVEAGDESNALVNEIFAVYEMGAQRGDRYSQIVLQNDFIKKHNIQLTEEDKKAIKQRGKELYDEIQQKRFALGLDEFDNTVPSEVSNYYDNLYKFTYEGAFRD
ncbi:hypothetical protein [Cellvibrio sp. OA-2007]|uniref:hypothetical protein n=1 Tax=Cellvibrio sp. OA-2007 TaxID=529823 RepID=UPI0007831F5D|nr:hypothetical protein [Cellvibrio sp. OA-2007]